MGRGLQPIEAIEELARFLPALSTATTNRVAGVGAPDFVDDVSPAALVTVLLRVVETQATGVLFAEGPTESRRALARRPDDDGGRKELYFVGGQLHHVASNNASELLGEYLVRRKRHLARGARLRARRAAALRRPHGRHAHRARPRRRRSTSSAPSAIRAATASSISSSGGPGRSPSTPARRAPHVEFPLDLELPAAPHRRPRGRLPRRSAAHPWRDRLDATVAPAAAPPPAAPRGRVASHRAPPPRPRRSPHPAAPTPRDTRPRADHRKRQRRPPRPRGPPRRSTRRPPAVNGERVAARLVSDRPAQSPRRDAASARRTPPPRGASTRRPRNRRA